MKNKYVVGMRCYLSELELGQSAKVISINNSSKLLKRRLLDMGLTPGVEITIKKIAPLRDPIDLKIRGYELCLRIEDLRNILVEVVR